MHTIFGQFETGRRGKWATGGLALLASVALAGCGEDRIALFPTTGSIRVGEMVPQGAQIVLHPQGHELPPEAIPTARVAGDGTFVVGTYDAGDGAPAGEYKATVQWFRIVSNQGGSGRGPNVLPPEYGDATRTPISITISEGENTIPPITIESKRRSGVASRHPGARR